jgi:hypothetical protein
MAHLMNGETVVSPYPVASGSCPPGIDDAVFEHAARTVVMYPRVHRIGVIGVVLLAVLVVAAGGGLANPDGPTDSSTARAEPVNSGPKLGATAPTFDVDPRSTGALGPPGPGEGGPTVDDGTVFVVHEESSRAVPNGIVGQVGRAIVSDALLGTLTAIGVASLLTGLVAGTVVLGLVRLLGYSWAPPRLLAARLLRRPYEDVDRWAVVALHYGLAVFSLVAAGAVYLGGSILLAVYGPAGGPLLGTGPMVVAALLLLGGVAAWAAFAYRWLPAAADAVDRPIEALRRQAAVVGVAYAVVAGPLFAFLMFLVMMAIFFR